MAVSWRGILGTGRCGALCACVVVIGCGEEGMPDVERYSTSLALLPVDAVTALTVSGRGTVAAELRVDTLVIEGVFHELDSPAAEAHVRLAPPALRGPAVFDLAVTRDTRGTLAGRFVLDADQIGSLRARHYYVQVTSEKNPEGAIRGWLFPDGPS